MKSSFLVLWVFYFYGWVKYFMLFMFMLIIGFENSALLVVMIRLVIYSSIRLLVMVLFCVVVIRGLGRLCQC